MGRSRVLRTVWDPPVLSAETRSALHHARWPVGTGHPFSLHQQIFIDAKPTFYDFANTTEMLTSAEVFAQVDPDGS